ncbi:hypothetical protein C453_12141 [Haloferax elongans ATCC BAA-1513]|uniref:Protein-glutamine gamma-glutamyltransferase-like C-terminal domain-containing protein n=1 Tax=Haloferax elongans ATCC BAA-1513 TaxID=1230453 RepID=M0HJN3_HALEO|nr:carboxypeptidase regulatory-like domain-containing protein [Haloferax elongans]ELZ84765.1 hypothetical protein C453_12141 [Haloferax elongans ATCC BAA-1513]
MRPLVLAVAFLLLASAVSPAVAFADFDGEDAVDGAPIAEQIDGETVGVGQMDGETDETGMQNETNETNASSPPRHLDPDETVGQGNVSSIEAYLVTALGERLKASAEALSDDDYQRAREILGPEYDTLLDRYELIASDRDLDTTGTNLVDTREGQLEYIQTVQEYDRTYQRYLEAKAAGNENRARTLARELDELAVEAGESRTRLEANYTEVESSGGVELGVGRERLDTVSTSVEQGQEQVRDAEFRRTQIEAESGAVAGSFADPFPIAGRVTETDGEPLGDASLNITVGAQSTRVVTDADGSFSLDYRPTMVGTGPQNVSVSYVPDPNSSFLGSTTVLSLRIEQSTPAFTVDAAPTQTAYGETVRVEGRMFVNETPAPNATVALSLDGRTRAQNVTDEDGRFVFELDLPADVAPGDRQLRVEIPAEERALAPVNVTRPVVVETTATSVRLANVAPTDEGVRVSGTFRTVDQTPISNVTLDVRVDGTSVERIRTDEQGRFATTLELDDEQRENGSVAVSVAYPGRGSNLLAAESESVAVELGVVSPARPAIPAPALPSVPLPGGQSVTVQEQLLVGDVIVPTGAVALGTVVVIVLGGLVALRRIGTVADGVGVAPSPIAGRARVGGGRGAASSTGRSALSPRELLRLARERLSDDPAGATERAYIATRRRLRDAAPGSDSETHTEFYESVRDGIADSDMLRSLTEWYERAAFSPRAPSHEEASTAVGTAEALINAEEDPSSEDEPGDGSDTK